MLRFLAPPAVTRRLHPRNFLLLACLVFILLCWTTKQAAERAPDDKHLNQTAHHLLDLPHFRLLLNSGSCPNGTFLVIVIHSAPDHFEDRNSIRETWGSPGLPDIRTVFLLARPASRALQARLQLESEEHGDIVQGNFIDSYRNLTYKHVMGLRWTADHCRQARFVMKMDDDIFVDIYQLVNLLRNQLTGLGKQFACYYQHQMPVVRDPESKWFVSRKEYAADKFEDYCSGWAYVIRADTAKLLADTAAQVPYFWIDDVHITGTVARRAGVGLVRLNRYFALETDPLAEWIRSRERTLWSKIFAPTWGDKEIMHRAHRRAKLCYREKCICCFAPTTQKPAMLSTKVPITGKSLIKLLLI